MNENKINFCTKCNKVVPEDEIMQFTPTGKRTHRYYKTVNFYRNMPAGAIGYCPVQETIYCGEVREPTHEECLAYELIKE